jgi:hypothetical protein
MIDRTGSDEIGCVDASKNKPEFTFKELDYIQFNHDRIDVDFTKLWSNKGHSFGEGLVSPDQQFFSLKIPKNASSFLVKNLVELDWEHANIEDWPESNLLVVLRDPIDRWISGMVEYLFLYHEPTISQLSAPFNYEFLPLLGERLGLSLLFERMSFDDHTERQCSFLQNVSLSKITWFRFDEGLKTNLSNFLTLQGYKNTLNEATKVNSNDTDTDPEIATLKRKLKELLTFAVQKDPRKRSNLEQWMWCDTELYNQVAFYDANKI